MWTFVSLRYVTIFTVFILDSNYTKFISIEFWNSRIINIVSSTWKIQGRSFEDPF